MERICDRKVYGSKEHDEHLSIKCKNGGSDELLRSFRAQFQNQGVNNNNETIYWSSERTVISRVICLNGGSTDAVGKRIY